MPGQHELVHEHAGEGAHPVGDPGVVLDHGRDRLKVTSAEHSYASTIQDATCSIRSRINARTSSAYVRIVPFNRACSGIPSNPSPAATLVTERS
jgi:hypothetical protein